MARRHQLGNQRPMAAPHLLSQYAQSTRTQYERACRAELVGGYSGMLTLPVTKLTLIAWKIAPKLRLRHEFSHNDCNPNPTPTSGRHQTHTPPSLRITLTASPVTNPLPDPCLQARRLARRRCRGSWACPRTRACRCWALSGVWTSRRVPTSCWRRSATSRRADCRCTLSDLPKFQGWNRLEDPGYFKA